MMALSDRDLRIDFLRGLALIIIFIDHVPANVLSRFTPRTFGFSSAADAFVLLAGISAGLAYGAGSAQNGIRPILPRLLRRIAQLYSAHLALLWISIALTAAATLVFKKAEFMERAVPALVQTDLLVAAWSSLALILQPVYLDILPLYVVLLLALPLFLLLERAQRGAALVLSVAIWVLAERIGLNLPSSRSPDGWYFNPFAWQLLFCIGLLGAHTIRHPPQAMRSYRLIAIAVAYVMLAFALTTPCGFSITANSVCSASRNRMWPTSRRGGSSMARAGVPRPNRDTRSRPLVSTLPGTCRRYARTELAVGLLRRLVGRSA
jgi:hypothetical protein